MIIICVLDELYMAFVTSKKAYANILSVDASEALTMPGVVDYICHTDVPGHNKWGTEVADEEIFATSQVGLFFLTLHNMLALRTDKYPGILLDKPLS